LKPLSDYRVGLAIKIQKKLYKVSKLAE